jgi:hypothetical protein
MAVDTLISVEEYLNTSYEPDMEYVDGVLVGRNIVFALRRTGEPRIELMRDEVFQD